MILFCTPCYGGMLHAEHFKSCMDLKEALTQMGLEHDWLIRSNESLVHRARMGMTKKFLDSDYTHMMWLDADISFTPDDVAKVWNLLEGETKADIGVGVYRMKTPESKYAAWVDGKLVEDLSKFKEPMEVDYAGTGFMMIKREVIENLSEKVDFYDNEVPNIPALYMTPIENGVLLSEDYYFCNLARNNGYKIIMDPSVKLTHWGMAAYD